MELKTKDLILRTVTKDDIDEVARMYEYPNTLSLENAEKAINTMKTSLFSSLSERETNRNYRLVRFRRRS